jgi:hypothetical protein
MMLNLLDELDIAGDTIVIYSTDYGPHMSFSPDEVATYTTKRIPAGGAFLNPEVVPAKIF